MATREGTRSAPNSIKVNCDASKMGNEDLIGFGCVIRDSNGVWQHGCAGIIHHHSVLQGELFAIWKGLMLASELDYKDVLCETNCHEAFILINDSVLSSFNETSCLIRRIKDLLQR
ncbi:hypothetical protein PIB30_029956 [Stylosanthes scabra]|uniref:RNase H type-1 domain-containing protein n=1 Tax=Stylosanthes scabra TaxID=79078 RepID=A0ABU6WEZ9_9FABA|nr:hypothetical protein [Stylosanthes scabra]